MKHITLMLPVLFCVACETLALPSTYLANPDNDYVISTFDDPIGQKFLIMVKSKSKNDICLYDGTWPDPDIYRKSPNRGELISQLDAVVTIVSQTNTYQPRTPNVGGHCEADTIEQVQQQCAIRLKPGESITAELPYAFFNTEILTDDDREKELNYSANLPFCDVFPD